MGNIDLKEYTSTDSNKYKIGELYESTITVAGVPKGDIAIFDDVKLNFHFYPRNLEVCKEWENDIQKRIDDIRKIIEKDANHVLLLSKHSLNCIPDEDKDKIHFWASERGGALKENGETICRLFKYIAAVKNKVLYELNFMRFFISKNDNSVNCIVKSLQLDRVVDKGIFTEQSVNHSGICYTTSHRGQSEKTLNKLIDRNYDKSLFYNPQVSFDDPPQIILNEFVGFINKCDENSLRF